MTQARRLTPEGIRQSRQLLAQLRADLTLPAQTPEHILHSDKCSTPFPNAPTVHHRPFQTRRDAAEYLLNLKPPLDAEYVDDWPFWSWLGMFHLSDVLSTADRRGRISNEDETFVVDSSKDWSTRAAYRHYLWISWRLADHYGDAVAYCLDRDISRIDEITRQITNSRRVFQSLGVASLILHLYTDGRREIPNRKKSGGLRHLLRVLEQLELTHDVYGMPPDALLNLLPPEFDRWRNNAADRA